MSSVYDLIELHSAIAARPEFFLQKRCIFQLRAFLRGFCLFQNAQLLESDGQLCKDHQLLQQFDQTIREKYCYLNVNLSIEEILAEAEGEEAFDHYFQLWNVFHPPEKIL